MVADKASIPPCLKVRHQLPTRFRLEFRRLVSREDQDRHAPALFSPPELAYGAVASLDTRNRDWVCWKTLVSRTSRTGWTSWNYQKARPRLLHGSSWQACVTFDDWAEPSRPGWGSEPVRRTECSLVRRQEWGTAGAERLRFAVCGCPERRLQPTATSKLLSQPVTSN